MDQETDPKPAAKAATPSDAPIGPRKLFMAGSAGTLLAYGAFWIGQFPVIRDWCAAQGTIAAIGAAVFFALLVLIAGWITADARPRRIHGALSMGLGLPGAIMAANVAMMSRAPAVPPAPPSDVAMARSAFFTPFLADDGGLLEFLRPVFAPISVSREYHNREQLEKITELGTEVQTLRSDVRVQTQNVEKLEGRERQLQSLLQGAQGDARRLQVRVEQLTTAAQDANNKLRQSQENLTRVLEEFVRLGAHVPWQDSRLIPAKRLGAYQATLAAVRKQSEPLLERLSRDPDRRVSAFSQTELARVRNPVPIVVPNRGGAGRLRGGGGG